MRVTVTQKHIDRGVPYDPGQDPIALAIRDIRRGKVRVHYAGALADDYDVVVGPDRYYHSRASDKFLRDHDAGRPVHPATFVLRDVAKGRGYRTDT